MVYSSEGEYVATATSLKGKVTKIDQIIAALEDAALSSAAKSGIEEYMLDDGQSKIKTIYRSVESIIQSIKSFEALRQMYLNRINGGRIVRLLPGEVRY